MKFLFLTLSFLLGGLTMFSQTTSCKSFHTGVFRIAEDGKMGDRIKRTKKFQYEISGKKKVKLAIEWLDACTYKLTFIKSNKVFRKTEVNNYRGKVLIVKILETKGNTCLITARFETEREFGYTGTIMKIK